MEPTFNSNHIITVTELTGVMGNEGERTLDICSGHIVSYADGVIHTESRIINVSHTRIAIRHLMETALLT